MTSTSYGVIIGSIAVACYLATEAKPAEPTDNLFLAVGGGGRESPGDDATGYGVVGFNWGIPLNHDSAPEDVGVGLQLGADHTLREGHDEWGATAGIFARRLPSFGEQKSAAALLLDYFRTTHRADVWALRPILGTTITDRDAVGVTGSIGLRDDRRQAACAECLEEVRAFWTRDWNDDLVTELSAGLQGSDVDEAVFAVQAAYSLSPDWDVTVGAEVNTDAAYQVGLRFSYHFGGLRRHDSVHLVRGRDAARFTPWPRRLGGAIPCGASVGSADDPEPRD